MIRIRSFIARWLRFRVTEATRNECLELIKELFRQGIPFCVDDTPLRHVPLDRLTEGQVLQLIAECRRKMAAHARAELLRCRSEVVRAPGMGVLAK